MTTETSADYESLRIRARVSRLAVITPVALTLAGCTIASVEHPPKGMRCIKAHDQDGSVVCDTYSPVPEATP